MEIKKNLNEWNTFKKFFLLLFFDEKKTLWILIIYGIFISLCTLVIPISVQTFVNTIGFALLLQPILILTFLVSAVLLFSGLLSALQIYTMEILQQRIFVKVAMALALRIPRYSILCVPKNRPFYEMNYFLEVATLQKTATVLILDATSVVLQVFFGLFLVAFYHPFLLALNVLILIFIFFFFIRKLQAGVQSSFEESKAKYAVVSWLYEVATQVFSFRSKETRDTVAWRTDTLTSEYVFRRKKHFRILFQQIIGGIFLEILVSSLLLGVGGWLVIKEQLTLGQLVASELVLSMVVLGVAKSGKYLESYYDFAAALAKIGYLLEIPIEQERSELFKEGDPKAPLLKISSLPLSAASSYPLSCLVTVEVEPGQCWALVGARPSVRSHLLELIYGLKETHSGILEFKGTNISYASLEGLRAYMGYVKKMNITAGSILEHLRFDKKEISVLEIQEVLKKICLYDALVCLPKGLDTQVLEAEDRLNLSLTLRLVVARVLLEKPQLILIDEGEAISKNELKWLDALCIDGLSMIVHVSDRESLGSHHRVIDLDGGPFVANGYTAG